jgi:hypothetical protein
MHSLFDCKSVVPSAPGNFRGRVENLEVVDIWSGSCDCPCRKRTETRRHLVVLKNLLYRFD